MEISNVDVNTYKIPLPEPVEAYAAGLMKAFDLVICKITNNNGIQGVGYITVHENQGLAISQIIKNSFKPLLLKQDPTCTSKINCFIKEKVLKTWRLKQKTLATSLSSSLKKSSTSSSTSQLNQNRWPISAFKPPGYYRNRESPLNISRNEEPTENERNKEAVR